MPRLFAGLELPEAIRDALMDLEQPLPGTRWIAAEDLHVTLRFAGDVDKQTERDFIDALATIDLPMFVLRLSGLTAPGGRQPRAIWADVLASDALSQLQAATERAARSAGLEPETRRFRPHVTLARIKKSRDEAIARYLGHHGGFTTDSFPVGRFALFSARPNTGGGPYVVEEIFPLQGGSWDDDDAD